MNRDLPMEQDVIVVKLGGAEEVDAAAVCRDLAALDRERGRRLVLVHGGSAEATRLGQDLGHPPRFVTSPSGHTSRLTDGRTLDIFLMATALLNRRLVCALQRAGVDALGLSGVDGALLRAERKRAIRVVEGGGRVRVVRDDQSGRPRAANGELLGALLAAGHLPVVAPVGLSEEGTPLNLDADRAAACLAGALGASTLVILTAVPGVLRDRSDPSTLVRHVPRGGTEELLGLAEGRMRKKVLGAQEALEAGVERVVIAGARGASPVRDALAGRGTLIGSPLVQSPTPSRS